RSFPVRAARPPCGRAAPGLPLLYPKGDAVHLPFSFRHQNLGCTRRRGRLSFRPPYGTCAVSSGVEHHIDIVGVTGSNPVSRTILFLLSPFSWIPWWNFLI